MVSKPAEARKSIQAVFLAQCFIFRNNNAEQPMTSNAVNDEPTYRLPAHFYHTAVHERKSLRLYHAENADKNTH